MIYMFICAALLTAVNSNPVELEIDDADVSKAESQIVKRGAGDCGSGCEPEGCYSRKCRSSCINGEQEVSVFNHRCSGQKCCMCHQTWRSCTLAKDAPKIAEVQNDAELTSNYFIAEDVAPESIPKHMPSENAELVD